MARNPFKFGDPVRDEFYLPRPALSNVVRQFVENQVNIVLIGPRRFGKTSFILDTLKGLEGVGRIPIYIDIYNITSHRDFLRMLILKFREKQSWWRKLKDWFVSIPRLRPKFSLDVDQATGSSSVGMSLSSNLSPDDVKDVIVETLKFLKELGPNIVVAFDEFQTITELDDDGWLEATLRSSMQSLHNTTFIFSGSRHRIINEMLNDSKRPFFRSCQPIDFPSFGPEFTDWVAQRFNSVGMNCDINAVEELRKLVQDTPNYVQMACFHLVAKGITNVNISEVKDILKTIVKQNSYAYQTLLNSLTPIQQRVLRLAAIEQKEIFSKNLLDAYEISSAPALSSAINALKKKQILDEGTSRGVVTFDDPLFAIWLKMEFI
ncbi:MAG: ATP-binding protein [Oligoflexales bacterium]|nr:ATP-binding protein [Oligoflexales bacterium]